MLSPEAMIILKARYLQHGETPEEMFRRVAEHVAKAEMQYGQNIAAAAEEYYKVMANLEFLPNSPALINAGKSRAQLAACFVLPIEDSLTGIFETLKNTALIHQSGGGTGFSFSRLRPSGDLVTTTGGIASGPISFMQVFDVATEVVKQGAARLGANMAILRVDHPDIEKFITAKRQHNVLNNFNLSVGITDTFMQAVETGSNFDLVNPKNHEVVKQVPAKDIFSLIVRMAWESGEPGLFFLDTVNRFNPTPPLGEFEAPNPCSEQPLLPYESCVLGSINLTKMIKQNGSHRQIDYDHLRAVIRTAVNFLDNVIDINDYPLQAVAEATRLTRKIGLGVMGLADMLIMLDIPYGSKKATAITGDLMRFITSEARNMSGELGRRRGSFPAFWGSTYAREGWPAMRNATVTTIAPTGSISLIAGCSSGIEPLFALSLTQRVLLGEVLVTTNKVVLDYLLERQLLTPEVKRILTQQGSIWETSLPDGVKKVLATAHEIPPYWHVAQLAAAQQPIDNGVAKTVNMPYNSTEEDVWRLFYQAYVSGCKGVTVYRDGSREKQVLTTGNIKCEDCGCEF